MPHNGLTCSLRCRMIWSFERGDEVIRLETRIDNSKGDYILVIEWAERPPETERFTHYEAYHARLRGLEAQLAADHWALIGGRKLLADGGRGPTPHGRRTCAPVAGPL